MASQSISPFQVEATMPAPPLTIPPKQPLSRWWLVSLLILSIPLISVGVFLMGVGYTNYGPNYGLPYKPNTDPAYAGMIKAAYACLSIGGAILVTFWILATIRQRQKHPYPGPLPAGRPISKLWLINLGIIWPILVIVGAPLVGLGLASFNADYSTPEYDKEYLAMIKGGLFCLTLGGAVFVAFMSVVIARQRQRRRARNVMPPVMYQNSVAPVGVAPPGQQMAPAPYTTQQQQQPIPHTAEVSGQNLQELSPISTQPPPSAAELGSQYKHQSPPAELGSQYKQQQPPAELEPQYKHQSPPAELGSQHKQQHPPAELEPQYKPPQPAAELGGQPYSAPRQHPGSPPARATAPASPAPGQILLLTAPQLAAAQHLASTQREASRPAGKEPLARFCRFCGAALHPATQLCRQCGV